MRTTLRTAGVAVRAMLVFTVLLGVGYMLLITGIGQLALPSQANGSLVRSADGTVVGSSLIAQSFQDADGQALPQYFQSRPSAASWDAAASTGSNLGPENADLIASISSNREVFEALNGAGAIPADAVTTSGSGLDPDISVANAERQAARIAEARGIPVSEVEALVAEHTLPRDLGFLGDPRVNVLELNRALDAR
ncbi:MAG: potassium-transporting ATPase subunit C [Microbacterium sp. 71-36]|uniref:potassium-transporting ATPase subunit KdpC n=1 Tax=unclassified Microbacterium TaxID=2609290 RepID=UPI00086C4421|nr:MULTISPECIES: potassium-transporting ATPase subunit KdpC [unclassified Microbacterium]MBN9212578.1 potassium-transporting ATPase subunit KdpC [Microbacterium sp.]ODT38141.1 MAG: potassium-transporting ATPase subunit C [Microbacterium sp. SCN 71-17]ODU51905.1 MAG: potassium-transporting ATPase subunit C [Microbacterium sp. SCN 70-10]OJV75420.1 MAG: potassium-transporting ATPase subunit C [Microbacterium sp. 71-36]